MPNRIVPKECVWCLSKRSLKYREIRDKRRGVRAFYVCERCSKPKFKCSGRCWCQNG